MKKCFLTFLFSVLFLFTRAQDFKDTTLSVNTRVESLLNIMTLDDKLSYIGGVDFYYIRAIPYLGLPALKMSDGPVGVRTWGPSTAYPAGICNAATWDRALINKLGRSLGRDALARGVNILLGPGLNIYRGPMCGRNFEYFGEDPYLDGQTAIQFVKGVQSQHVVATVKHFVANNEEWDRYNTSSNMDERTLREIYLPAFKAAVMDARAGAVMNAYNLLNGVHCTQNRHLNMDILKGDWGFKGVLMSDWLATHAGVAAANAGLDLEMPSATYMAPDTLKDALFTGKISEATIDDKVRRILRMVFSFGFYDHPQQTDTSIPLDDPESDSVSLNLAREGIVLLKNDSILPFDLSKMKSLAIIGPNADVYTAGGGSSYTTPFHYITTLQGIRDLVGDKLTIIQAGSYSPEYFATHSVFFTAPESQTTGLTGDYFSNSGLHGEPVSTRIDSAVDFHWSGSPGIAGIPGDNFSVRWTGIIRPDSSAVYSFYVSGNDGFRLWVNGEKLIDNWTQGITSVLKENIYLTAGSEDSVRLEYYDNSGLASIDMGYLVAGTFYKQVAKTASFADAALVCVGFNNTTEGETIDRSFEMDPAQDSIVNLVASLNPNSVVVINAGGSVDMQSWIHKIKGLVFAWYPGQDGGKALAEILFGITNPSGKLPVSFEKKWSDNPVYNTFYPNHGSSDIDYKEGVFLGYRYYDTYHVDPMFPFGFGLSYTTFKYSGLEVTQDSTDKYTVSFDVKNTGIRYGAEVAELYVSPDDPKISRPVQELKNYEKVFLQPGETKTVTLHLDASSFAYFDMSKNTFVVDQGNYDVIIGASSSDERLRKTIAVEASVITALPRSNFEKGNLVIYPNPVGDYLNLYIEKNTGLPSYYFIYDLNGRLVDKGIFAGQEFRYDTRHLGNSLYICRITSGQSVFEQKFVVSHR